MVKNVCFINNYNNGLYIGECLESVYSQTHAFDEVIIVDDGSTDDSMSIISAFANKHLNLKLLQKNNEGQFSCFNAVLPLISDRSQVFLLDGDDIYPRDYLELTLSQIGRDKWDFAFCEQIKFLGFASYLKTALINKDLAYFFPSTSALTRSRGCWIGNPTSCISISSELYKTIFPYPFFKDKSFAVDNLIIYIGSVLGAKKIHLPGIGVGWRSHQNNDSKKMYSHTDVLTKEGAIKKAIEWYTLKFNITRYPTIKEFFAEYNQLSDDWKRKLDFPNEYHLLNRLIRNKFQQMLSAIR
jgi:glycosyltransferase involved in cell wall biosynthesis